LEEGFLRVQFSGHEVEEVSISDGQGYVGLA
jgi:hypothetical protein